MPYLSSKLFNYDHETNTFSAWVSELGKNPFGRIYGDSCDMGCSIVSDKTGNVADFYIFHEEKDQDRDVVAWHLKPTRDSGMRFPLLKDATVVIFND